jgi:hypothetical protein
VFESANESEKAKIRVIQNNALRTIFKKKRQFGNDQLHALAKEASLDKRLLNLKRRFITKSIDSNNPIICPLIKEYNDFAGGRELKISTPLCNNINNNDLSSIETNQIIAEIENDMYSSYTRRQDMYSSYTGPRVT